MFTVTWAISESDVMYIRCICNAGVPGATLSAAASSGEICTAAISWRTSTMLMPKRSSSSGKIGPVWFCSIRPTAAKDRLM